MSRQCKRCSKLPGLRVMRHLLGKVSKVGIPAVGPVSLRRLTGGDSEANEDV
jgi:hypothetical protein